MLVLKRSLYINSIALSIVPSWVPAGDWDAGPGEPRKCGGRERTDRLWVQAKGAVGSAHVMRMSLI